MAMKAVAEYARYTSKTIIVNGRVELSGSYAAKGVTLDLSTLGIPASQKPLSVFLWSEVSQGAAALMDFYAYVPGSGPSDGKVQIVIAGAEMGAAAYSGTSPTNATGYKLKFEAEFLKNI